jgi:hypothetical protein
MTRRPKHHRRINTTDDAWVQTAAWAAAQAHESFFEHRQGILLLNEGHGAPERAMAYFNNHPFDAGKGYREEMLAQLRSGLQADGIEVLATASYPVDGDGAGYTQVLVVRDRPEVAPRIEHHARGAFERAVDQSASGRTLRLV